MRQVKGDNAKGKPILGRSCGYGFVAFKEHTAALQCLKQMNNNPHMFTNERVTNLFILLFIFLSGKFLIFFRRPFTIFFPESIGVFYFRIFYHLLSGNFLSVFYNFPELIFSSLSAQ